jgi:hypothetical protein
MTTMRPPQQGHGGRGSGSGASSSVSLGAGGTKEESLSLAKQIAEDWYLELRGKDRAGLLKSEKLFRQVTEQFLKEYEIITKGHRSPCWGEGHGILLRLHYLPFFGELWISVRLINFASCRARFVLSPAMVIADLCWHARPSLAAGRSHFEWPRHFSHLRSWLPSRMPLLIRQRLSLACAPNSCRRDRNSSRGEEP